MSEPEPGAAESRQIAVRVTPYELAFGEAGMADRLFPRIDAAVEREQIEPARRDALVLLPEVTTLVRELVPSDAPPDAFEQHRAVLFHAFNFWRYGKRLYLFEPAVARYLVEAKPSLSAWEYSASHTSSYVQLPANLFWASIAPDAPPEPVDGFFVTASAANPRDAEPRVYMLDALMVLGIRRHRAGFSVIPFQTEVGGGLVPDWCDEPAREQGQDFESVLPGGDLAGMYSIVTSAESLKLVCRMIWYLDSFRSAVVYEEPPERRATDRAGSVRRSRLPFHRVVLRAEPDGGA
jgi:hypothetical protein